VWHRRYGDWWMVQWELDGWISLGIHIDFRHHRGINGHTYGPYVDLHLGVLILSLGRHPVYAGELDLKTSVAIQRELG
jgi:hypothetical protein